MQEFVVTRKEAGGRFDKYLKKLLPLASSGFLYRMLRKKNITLNDKKAEGKEMLAEKDVVKLFFSEETYQKFSGRFGELSEQEEIDYKGCSVRKLSEDYRKTNTSSKLRKDYQKSYSFQKSDERYLRAFHQLGKIPVIYEDDDILILNKPAGVLSQKAEKGDISLNEWMIGYLFNKKEITEEELLRFRPSVCNRLDRNTSGLLLCGKTLRGSQFLAQILRDRSLHKYYLTYVQGRIGGQITLKGYLKKEEEKNLSEVISEEEYQKKFLTEKEEKDYRKKILTEKAEEEYLKKAGNENRHKHRTPVKSQAEKEYQKIETVIKPLSYYEKGDCTKLEILLVTGKSHQIRAHLSGIGHPVLGDIKYGWKPKREEETKFRNQLLHAYRVEFPETKGEFAYLSRKAVTAPVPDLMKKLEESFVMQEE